MHSERPNVMMVVLEGARADHLGCYGYERDTTPFLDQLAREGVRFTQAFSTAAVPLAAHASLLTGLMPAAHGATEESGALGTAAAVLPEQLKAAGYRTAAFCPDPAVAPETGFGRGFDRFYTQRTSGRITDRAADYARRASDRVLGRGDAGARRTNQALLDWLAAGGPPWFAYVVYREPAQPERTPAPYDRMFTPAAAAHSSEPPEVGRYDGALRYADMRLKAVADVLDACGEWERTIAVVTASHGLPLAAGESERSLCDAVLHVPLLIVAPTGLPRGFVVDEFAQPTDLLPTVLALAGVTRRGASGQGRALLGEHGATGGPGFIVAEGYRSAAVPVRRKVIRTRREKFCWQSDEANALYDLGRDPAERCNVLAEDTARADRLRRRLFDWLAATERWGEERGVEPAVGDGSIAREQHGGRE